VNTTAAPGFRMWCKVQSAWHLLLTEFDGDEIVIKRDLEYEVYG
jgi:hypothetical protein